MPKIEIKGRPSNLGWHFKVQLIEGENFSEFSVTMDRDFYSRLSTNFDIEPEKVVEKSFEFLLENEAPQQILPEFDIATIERYFPSFIGEIQKRLESSLDS
jgi:hypothetical protein